MREKLKRPHFNVTAQACLFLILGLVLLLFPGTVTNTLVRFLAFLVILIGAITLAGGLMEGSIFTVLSGGLLTLVGLWAYASPATVASFLPAIFGLVMLYHGIQDIFLALESRDYGFERWGRLLLAGIVSLLLGFVAIIAAF